MVFFIAIGLFRLLIFAIVFIGFTLFKKDPSETTDPNSIVSTIVAGAFGYVTMLIYNGEYPCFIVKDDSITNFVYLSKNLFLGGLIGGVFVLMSFALIVSPFMALKGKINRLYNLKVDSIYIYMFIPMSLHTLANVSTVALVIGFLKCP